MSDDGDDKIVKLIPGKGKGTDTEEEVQGRKDFQVVQTYLEDPMNCATIEIGLASSHLMADIGPTNTVGLLITQAIKIAKLYSPNAGDTELLRRVVKDLIDDVIDGVDI